MKKSLVCLSILLFSVIVFVACRTQVEITANTNSREIKQEIGLPLKYEIYIIGSRAFLDIDGCGQGDNVLKILNDFEIQRKVKIQQWNTQSIHNCVDGLFVDFEPKT